jgi:hypothetical protein
MERPDKGRKRRTWRFKLDDSTILEVSAPRGVTEKQVRRRGRLTLAFGAFVAALIMSTVAWADRLDADADALATATPAGNALTASQQPGTTVAYDLSAAIVETGNSTDDVFAAAGDTVNVSIVRSGDWLALSPGSPTSFSFTEYDTNQAGTIRVTVPCGAGAGTSKSMTAVLTAGASTNGKTLNPDSVTLTYAITAQGEDAASCAPANAAPVVNTPSVTPEPSDEGQSVVASATFSDDGLGGGPITCSVDYDDGSGPLAGTVSGNATSGTCTGPAHTYADDDDDVCSGGVCNVSVTVSDGSLPGSNSSAHVVNNVAPAISSLVAGSAASCGSANSLTINFTDPAGGNDTYSASIDWGDGTSSSPASITSGHVANHTYAAAGSYTASVTVSDEDGGTSTAVSKTLVVNYTVTSLLPPINNTGHGENPSIFKYGSTVPVKLEITDCDGSHPSTLDVRVFAVKTSSIPPSDGESEAAVANQADAGNQMRFSDPIYVFNWSTKSISDATSTVLVTVKIVATGQTVSAVIGLKAK